MAAPPTWPSRPPGTARTALITRTGADPFGRFVHQALRELDVDDRWVTPVQDDLLTPVTFCEIFPPDHFPLYFYRLPTAPDLQLTAADLPAALVRGARVFWTTGSACRRSRAARRTTRPGRPAAGPR